MADRKKVGLVGSLLAALAAGGIGLAQLTAADGPVVAPAAPVAVEDVRAGFLPRLPKINWRPPPIPSGLPVVVEAVPVQEAIEQGVATFRALRRGEPAEKAAVDVGCAVMSAGISRTDSYESVERKAYSYLPLEYRKGQRFNWVVDKPMGKVVTALAVVGGSQGGSLYHYARYCRQV